MRLLRLSLIVASLACGPTAAASGATHSGRARIARIVAGLGGSSTSYEDYRALEANRCIALPLLAVALRKLPTVPQGKVGGALGRPINHLTLRTSLLLEELRALTGHEEYGPITSREFHALPFYREVPGGDFILKRDSLIAALPRGRSRYYGYWMSRLTYFYAPARTQPAIKAQWPRFVAKFDCRARLGKPPREPDVGMSADMDG